MPPFLGGDCRSDPDSSIFALLGYRNAWKKVEYENRSTPRYSQGQFRSVSISQASQLYRSDYRDLGGPSVDWLLAYGAGFLCAQRHAALWYSHSC